METAKKYWWIGLLIVVAIVAVIIWKRKAQTDNTNTTDTPDTGYPPGWDPRYTAQSQPRTDGVPNHSLPASWSANPGKNIDTPWIKQEPKGALTPAAAAMIADAMGATAFYFPAGNGYIEYKSKGPFITEPLSWTNPNTSGFKRFNGTVYTKNGV